MICVKFDYPSVEITLQKCTVYTWSITLCYWWWSQILCFRSQADWLVGPRQLCNGPLRSATEVRSKASSISMFERQQLAREVEQCIGSHRLLKKKRGKNKKRFTNALENSWFHEKDSCDMLQESFFQVFDCILCEYTLWSIVEVFQCFLLSFRTIHVLDVLLAALNIFHFPQREQQS